MLTASLGISPRRACTMLRAAHSSISQRTASTAEPECGVNKVCASLSKLSNRVVGASGLGLNNQAAISKMTITIRFSIASSGNGRVRD